jgi:hypothetical protein
LHAEFRTHALLANALQNEAISVQLTACNSTKYMNSDEQGRG